MTPFASSTGVTLGLVGPVYVRERIPSDHSYSAMCPDRWNGHRWPTTGFPARFSLSEYFQICHYLTATFSHTVVAIFKQSCFQNLDLLSRSILSSSLNQAHPLYNSQTTSDSTEYCMLPVQPRGWRKCNEELAPICIRATVCHAQYPGTSMLKRCMYLILKLFAINGAAPSSCTGGISGLDHEVRYYAVDDNIVIIASLRERGKILARLT